MNNQLLVLFGFAIFVLVAEVSGRSPPIHKHVGLKDKEYDGCGCNERIVKAKATQKHPLRLPCECDRPGDTCRCTKVKITPAALPRPKHYKHQESEERCSKYIHAPKYMHDFGSDEVKSKDDEFVKVPVDTVSMNIAQELQRKADRKQTEEDLSYGFRSIPAERPLQKFWKNVPEGDLQAYEKTIVELQPYKILSDCDDDDLDAFTHDVKQPISYLSYGDVGYAPIKGKAPTKFLKKTCMVKESHESHKPHNSHKPRHPQEASESHEYEEESHDVYVAPKHSEISESEESASDESDEPRNTYDSHKFSEYRKEKSFYPKHSMEESYETPKEHGRKPSCGCGKH